MQGLDKDDMNIPFEAHRKLDSVELLCVGTELLMGQIVNTNASNLAKRIADLGLNSYYQTVVGDHPDRMKEAMRQALGRSDVVLVTGGLGPTDDDLSMEIAAEVAEQPMIFDEEAWETIQAYFSRQDRSTPPNNRKQAYRPKNAYSIPNHNGTAPGAIVPVDESGKTHFIILLPGPPRENLFMFDETVAPFLAHHREQNLRSIFVQMQGIGESHAVDIVEDLIQGQSNPTIAPYASEGQVTFRLTQSIEHPDDPDLIAPLLHEISERLGEHIFEIGERDIFAVLLDHMRDSGTSLSCAESCTGGRLLSSFIDYPGASDVIEGGLVTYSNKAKMQHLGVPEDILKKDGAVSEACVRSMAEGCRREFETTYALATSGIAGPGGGTKEKPVGLTYIGLATPDKTYVNCHQFRGKRDKNRRLAAVNAAALLWRTLRERGEIAFGEELYRAP